MGRVPHPPHLTVGKMSHERFLLNPSACATEPNIDRNGMNSLSERTHTLHEAAAERVLILDGAMGTMIQRHRLSEEDFRGRLFAEHERPLKGNNDVLCLTRPEVVKGIHAEYLAAGADLVETNTFSATRIAQADYGLEDWAFRINEAAARIAREAANEAEARTGVPRFVAGALGPTNKTASLSPDVNRPGFRAITFTELVAAYREQADGLMAGGADALLVETIFDTLNAKAALFAIEEAFDARGERLPILISGTITDASGRTLSGQTTEAFLISLQHVPAFSIGLNCALGAEQLTPFLEVMAREAPCRVSAYPNAGLPNELGEYDQGPDAMAEAVRPFLEQGWLNILGGCCGTTPDHIAALARVAAEYAPRPLPANAPAS